MPSAWGALTSARCFMSARTPGQSAFSAASASFESTAAPTLTAHNTISNAQNASRFSAISQREQFIDAPFAVGKCIKPHTDALEQREMEIRERRRLGVLDMTRAV